MLHLHLLFYYFHIYRPLLCGHLSGNEHWTVFLIVVDNQMFIVLARQLTIYSRRRLIKTSSQNQEVITIKK